MHPVQRWQAVLARYPGDGLVGGEHELLDQLVALVLLDPFESVCVALRIDEDLYLGHVEIEAAVAHPLAAERGGNVPQTADPSLEVGELIAAQHRQGAARRAGLVGGRRRQAADLVEAVLLEKRVGLAVGQALAAANDGVGKSGRAQAALVKRQQDGLGQAVLAFDEAAQPVGQLLRQHRDDGPDQIGGVAAALGFAVDRTARLHVAADVRDVHAHPHVAIRKLLDRQRVVEILRVVGIDGERRNRAEIEPAEELRDADAGGEGGGLAQHVIREVGRQPVSVIDRRQLSARFVGAAEARDDRPLGVDMALLPLVKLHHYLVTDRRHRTHARLGWIRHIDVVRETRVVGDDIGKELCALQIAGQRFVRPLDDSDDAADRLAAVAAAPRAAQFVAEPNNDLVSVYGHTGLFGRNLNRVFSRFAGSRLADDVGGAALTELDPAGDQISVPRKAKPVLLDAHDFACGQELADFGAERTALAFGQAKGAGDLRLGKRHVVGGTKQGQKAFAKLHDRRVLAEAGCRKRLIERMMQAA